MIRQDKCKGDPVIAATFRAKRGGGGNPVIAGTFPVEGSFQGRLPYSPVTEYSSGIVEALPISHCFNNLIQIVILLLLESFTDVDRETVLRAVQTSLESEARSRPATAFNKKKCERSETSELLLSHRVHFLQAALPWRGPCGPLL